MIGNLDLAIRKYVAFSSLRDSLNRQQVTRMEEKYALEKQMKEKELQQQQLDAEQQVRLERQKIISIAVGAGLILALALAFVLLKRNEEKRRSNMLLENQNREILNQKEEIETQHEITTQQRDKIAGQQKVITDSIRYAGRIQTVMLPDQQALSRVFYRQLYSLQAQSICEWRLLLDIGTGGLQPLFRSRLHRSWCSWRLYEPAGNFFTQRTGGPQPANRSLGHPQPDARYHCGDASPNRFRTRPARRHRHGALLIPQEEPHALLLRSL